MNEVEIIHKLEKKFDFLTNICFEHIGAHGDYVFSCTDIDSPAVLVVDKEGWVLSKVKGKKFYDTLGQIH